MVGPLTSVATGTKLTDGTEQNLFSDGGENFGYHMLKIYLDAMLAGDKIELRIYDWDTVAGAYKLFDLLTYQDAQTNQVAAYVPPIPMHRCQMSIKRTAGVDRSYNWERLSN